MRVGQRTMNDLVLCGNSFALNVRSIQPAPQVTLPAVSRQRPTFTSQSQEQTRRQAPVRGLLATGRASAPVDSCDNEFTSVVTAQQRQRLPGYMSPPSMHHSLVRTYVKSASGPPPVPPTWTYGDPWTFPCYLTRLFNGWLHC